MSDQTTLLAELLKKATSVGPARGMTAVPQEKFEDQQPDPFHAILDTIGDPLENSVPAHIPIIANGPPDATEQLLKMLIGFKPSELSSVEMLMKSRIGGSAPPPSRIKPPAGFTFSRKLNEKSATRPAELAEEYSLQKAIRNRFKTPLQPVQAVKSVDDLSSVGLHGPVKNVTNDFQVRQAVEAGASLPELRDKFPRIPVDQLITMMNTWVK